MNGNYLPPRLLQAVGILILIGSVAFWAITARESVLLVSAALSLIGLGAYRSAIDNLRRNGNGRS